MLFVFRDFENGGFFKAPLNINKCTHCILVDHASLWRFWIFIYLGIQWFSLRIQWFNFTIKWILRFNYSMNPTIQWCIDTMLVGSTFNLQIQWFNQLGMLCCARLQKLFFTDNNVFLIWQFEIHNIFLRITFCSISKIFSWWFNALHISFIYVTTTDLHCSSVLYFIYFPWTMQ